MRHRFDRFELDTSKFTLRSGANDIHVEPLVFDLLRFLVERAGQVVTRDTIVEHVWHGRFVSDATISSCIKSARKALGDDGRSQVYIRTIRGRGLQFAPAVESDTALAKVSARDYPPTQPATQAATRDPISNTLDRDLSPTRLTSPPRIAVLPMSPLSQDPALALMGDALAQEVILELSRLHSLFVIARGSSFKFRGLDVDLAAARELLGADYFLTGTIMENDRRCVVAVELARVPGSHVIWGERFTTPLNSIMHMRSTLAGEIAAALEVRVQLHEAHDAAKVPTEQLDAWAAYHRGLRHMYRFNEHDNRLASHLFAHALKVDSHFARAHAGLSFTHFQNAFLGFSSDADNDKRLTRAHADKSMELDPLDPFVNLTVGRAEWLSGNLEGGLPWMERSIALSPNYAFAIYNSALVGTLQGDGEHNEPKVARAISLSPIDPLNYAMLATRALTHVIRGNHDEAAEWAGRAVRAPNAHVQIYTIAAITHELAGNRANADAYVAHIRRFHPGYDRCDFLRAFPFRDENIRALMKHALQRLGL